MSSSADSASRAPAEQRLFSLLLALVASPQGLTKSQLLSTVHGYASVYRLGEKNLSLERQFERDKEEIRRLGVPIEVIDAPGEPGNTQLSRYRISKERLQLPADIRFTAAELTVLRLAALAWQSGSLDTEARRSTMKLAALGASLDVRQLGIAPSLGIIEVAGEPLRRAIDERKVVRFDYQLPDRSEALQRTVAPLLLHRADRRWHVIAWDIEREAPRVFLLSRITSAVTLTSEHYDPSLLKSLPGVLARLRELREQQRSIIRVRSGSVAEARLGARSERATDLQSGYESEVTLTTLDMNVLAEEIAGYGDEALVLSPDSLRSDVVSLLSEVRSQHATAGGE